MPPDAPEIKVKLTAEDTGVSAAIKELGNQLKNVKKQADETAKSAFSLRGAFDALATSFVAIKLAEFGKEAFDSAVNIGKMADKTGLTTQSLSVFHHVAEEAGIETEIVDKALIKAAKSITEFQLGIGKSAAGFKLLNITQKDFAGLKPDEKMALVTTRLGQMSAGFQKTTAAQLIFSKSGAEFIPVANAIAGEGFGKITESVAKLGLLLDQSTTDAFRAAKASMQELKDVGTGMATQFEAGLLPAISDIGDALLDSTLKGGDGFKEVGHVAGEAIKGIAFAFFFLGDSVSAIVADIENYFGGAWDEIRIGGTAVFEALGKAAHGDLAGAYKELTEGVRGFQKTDEEAAIKHKAIWDQTAVDIRKKQEDLFPSDQEEAQRAKARLARLRPDKQTEAAEPVPVAKPTDAAAKAQLAQYEKHLQDELALLRAAAKQAEQIDTEKLDKGEISLKQYFDRRRDAVTADAAKERDILQRGIALEIQAAQKAALAAKNAETPKEADKQKAIEIEALTKVEELQTKIRESDINSATKIEALNTEEFKKREENQTKILEFNKLVEKTQANELAAAKAEIAIEQQKMRIIFEQSGESKAEIDRKLASYERIKLAEVQFGETRKDGSNAMKALDDQRAAIEDKVLNGKLFQAQADQQILDLYRRQIPELQQIADKMKESATTPEETEAAAAFQTRLNQIKTETNTVGGQIRQLRTTLQDSLTGGMTQSFALLFQGTQNIGMAFRNMASSVIGSIAQMIAQMYIQIIVAKLLKAAMGGTGLAGGGLVPTGGGGGGGNFAEGGLIHGPGGPKSDSIPARVSPGEYIVRADAVSAFGVANLEAINRGLKVPSLERLALPKFAEGGLVGDAGRGSDSNIHLGIGLDEGLILKHLSSKAAGNVILQHLVNNPKAASKALSRSE
jgi:hypothetical protein